MAPGSAEELLARWLEDRLRPEQFAWLAERLAAARSGDFRGLALGFSMASRKLGKGDLNLRGEDRIAADAARQVGIRPSGRSTSPPACCWLSLFGKATARRSSRSWIDFSRPVMSASWSLSIRDFVSIPIHPLIGCGRRKAFGPICGPSSKRSLIGTPTPLTNSTMDDGTRWSSSRFLSARHFTWLSGLIDAPTLTLPHALGLREGTARRWPINQSRALALRRSIHRDRCRRRDSGRTGDPYQK